MNKTLTVAAAALALFSLAGCQKGEEKPSASEPQVALMTAIPDVFTPPTDGESYDPNVEAITAAYGWAADHAGATGIGFEITAADRTDQCPPFEEAVKVCRDFSSFDSFDPGVVAWNRAAMNELATDQSGGASVLAKSVTVFVRDGDPVCRAGEFVAAVVGGYTPLFTVSEEQGRDAAEAFGDQRDDYLRGYTQGCHTA